MNEIENKGSPKDEIFTIHETEKIIYLGEIDSDQMEDPWWERYKMNNTGTPTIIGKRRITAEIDIFDEGSNKKRGKTVRIDIHRHEQSIDYFIIPFWIKDSGWKYFLNKRLWYKGKCEKMPDKKF